MVDPLDVSGRPRPAFRGTAQRQRHEAELADRLFDEVRELIIARFPSPSAWAGSGPAVETRIRDEILLGAGVAVTAGSIEAWERAFTHVRAEMQMRIAAEERVSLLMTPFSGEETSHFEVSALTQRRIIDQLAKGADGIDFTDRHGSLVCIRRSFIGMLVFRKSSKAPAPSPEAEG